MHHKFAANETLLRQIDGHCCPDTGRSRAIRLGFYLTWSLERRLESLLMYTVGRVGTSSNAYYDRPVMSGSRLVL
jgi:hypothetical protein